MLDITFDKFRELPELRNLTLKELSVLICGEERLIGFLSKLATHHPVSVAANFKEVSDFVAKSGYNLILDNDFNKSLSQKDKWIKKLEERVSYLEDKLALAEAKLEGCALLLEGAELIYSAQESERLIKRPRKNKRGGTNEVK